MAPAKAILCPSSSVFCPHSSFSGAENPRALHTAASTFSPSANPRNLGGGRASSATAANAATIVGVCLEQREHAAGEGALLAAAMAVAGEQHSAVSGGDGKALIGKQVFLVGEQQHPDAVRRRAAAPSVAHLTAVGVKRRNVLQQRKRLP